MILVVVAAAIPVPVSVTVCGLPGALSLMLRVPVRVPLAVGEKVITTKQLLIGGRIFPLQVSLVFVKSPAFVPPMIAETTDKGAFPVLANVAVTDEVLESATAPKFAGVGARFAVGCAPLPVRGIDCKPPELP